MQLLNLLKKYIVDSQLWVSLCATALAEFFMRENGNCDISSLFLIFITYASGYIYTRFHRQHMAKTFVANGVLGCLSVLVIILDKDIIYLLKWLTIVALGLAYNSVFLKNYIRKIPYLKVFYVGAAWGLVNAFLCFPDFNFAAFFITFLLISALVLPFDIRDAEVDKITTFPKTIGTQNTKYLSYLLIFCACIVAVSSLRTVFAAAVIAGAIPSFLLIYFAESWRADSYFSVWVELCTALPSLFAILLSNFEK